MSDLVERLRRGIYCAERRMYEDDAMCDEAAAEIERLRAALEKISQFSSNPAGSGPAYTQCGNMVRIARAALTQEKPHD